MAQVARHLTDNALFEWDFSTTIGTWESLPEMAAEWTDWDIDSRMDFLTDWPVTEERTQRLLAMESALPTNDKRVAKLHKLRTAVDENRPVLEWLIANVTAR